MKMTHAFIRVEDESATGLLITSRDPAVAFRHYLRPGDTASLVLPPDYSISAIPEQNPEQKRPGLISRVRKWWAY